mmetsp:Transcript_84604/g.213371  ORF Transcript_84604/g.213371 Transcript_84604/m.213371 type:complete len:229 (+) Transcript_84604:139-825(+)
MRLRIVTLSSFHQVDTWSTKLSSASPRSFAVRRSFSHSVLTSPAAANSSTESEPSPIKPFPAVINSCLAAGIPVCSSTRARKASRESPATRGTAYRLAPLTTEIVGPSSWTSSAGRASSDSTASVEAASGEATARRPRRPGLLSPPCRGCSPNCRGEAARNGAAEDHAAATSAAAASNQQQPAAAEKAATAVKAPPATQRRRRRRRDAGGDGAIAGGARLAGRQRGGP